MPNQFKQVSANTKRLVDLANQVIRDCRAIVAMGAGNQEQNVTASKGRAHYLTGVVQNSPNYVWDRPLRNGGVTSAYGAGNCQDQAAVTYTILRSRLTAAETTAFCVNWTIKHSFATIGVPGTDADDLVVCVDPWPINAQAVLLADHFCKDSLQVLRNKHGGKGDYIARLNKHAPGDALMQRQYANANSWDTVAINTGGGMWNHEYCSNGGITWVYKVRKPWIADSARPQCSGCNTAFSFTRRRHHCRSCGEVFCDNCSTGRTVVGIPATEPGHSDLERSAGAVRVCVPCLNQITVDALGG